MKWRRVVDIIAILTLLGALTLGSSGAAPLASGRREPLAPNGLRTENETVGDRPAGESGTLGSRKVTVVRGDRLGESPPARSLPTYHPPKHPQQIEPVPDDATRVSTGGPSAPDAALQTAKATESMPAVDDQFAGISGGGYVPPDTIGDVGPNHYVQAVNLAFQVWDKDGTALTSPVAISSLFTGTGDVCETTDQGDPIVQYDRLADRWLITQFGFDVDLANHPEPPFYECVAVSTGPNPAGTYYRYAFEWPSDRFDDYPKIGVWPDGYYMSANEFSAAGSFVGVGVAAFERDQMLVDGPADMIYRHLTSDYSLLPSDLDGSAPPPEGTPNTYASIDDAFLTTRELRLFSFHVDFADPDQSTFTPLPSLTPATYDPDLACTNGFKTTSDCVPQPDTAAKLDSIPDRLMYRLAYRNYGAYESIVVTHNVDATGSERAGIRWYELRRSGGDWSILQQGTYSPNTVHRWMGSAAMDAEGDIAIGYSAANATTYPGIRYAGRLSSDPLGQLSQGENTMVEGAGSQTTSFHRWGDYTSMSVDPDDDCTFWYTNEYYETTSKNGWSTRIGHFKFPNCASNGSLSIDDVSVAEGDAGTSVATFTVTANPAPTSTVTVDWATDDGSATSPDDFAAGSGQLTFLTGDPTETIDVTINGDTDFEPDELFSVDLANATGGASIARARGTGTITNDDPQPPGFTVDDVQVTEGTGGTTPAVFTVTLTPASGSTETVDVDTADGTAVAPGDYTAVSQQLTFDPGDTTKQVSVDVNGDVQDENKERFTLDLSNGSLPIVEDQGTATILDDDVPGSCTISGTSGANEIDGTPGDDVICGLGGNDTIRGMGGDDEIQGGSGYDLITYDQAAGPVTVDLAGQQATGADGTDTLVSVEDVAGSDFNDEITGDDGGNILYGLGGKDLIEGGPNFDVISYKNAPAGISLNLNKGAASGGEGKDTLSGIEDAYGSAFNDSMTGSSASNFMYGLEGNDTLRGLGGADELFGNEGNDDFVGGKGNDRCTQGPGHGSKVSC